MSVPAPPSPSGGASKFCPACGAPHADWTPVCSACGRRVGSDEEAVRNELAHIAYLVASLDSWESRSLVPEESVTRLRAEYDIRARQLSELLINAAPAAVAPAHPSTPVTAGKEGTSDAADNAAPPAVPPLPERLSELAMDGGQAASPPASTTRPTPTRPFLQQHGLKMVFALATLLVLIAMRGLVQWTEFGEVAIRCVPLIPLGLTVMFFRLGGKTVDENRWAGFVYHAVACGLIAFDVVAMNTYWLGALRAPLPFRTELLGGASAATAAAGELLRRRKDVSYLHLFMTGLFLAVFALLQQVRAIVWASTDFVPAPLPLFALGYLCTTACAAIMAKRTAGAGSAGEPRELRTRAWTLWVHLGLTAVVLMVGLALAFQSGNLGAEIALVALMSGLIYAAGAQSLGDRWMVAVSSFLFAGAAVSWTLHESRFHWVTLDLLLLVAAMVALALTRYNQRLTNDMVSLAREWRLAGGIITGVGAGLGSAMLLWILLTPVSGEHIREARFAFALDAAYAAAAFLLAAWTSDRFAARWAYAGFVLVGCAVSAGLFCLRAPSWSYGFTLVLYAAALYGGGYSLAGTRQSETAADVWPERMRDSATGISLVAALVALLTTHILLRPTSGTVWFSFAAVAGSVALLLSDAWLRKRERSLFGSVIGLLMALVFCRLAASVGIAAAGVMLTAIALPASIAWLALSFRMEEARISLFSIVMAFASVALIEVFRRYGQTGSGTLYMLCNASWITLGVVSQPFWLRLARAQRSGFAAISGALALCAASLRAAVLVFHPDASAYALCLLPALALVAVFALRLAEADQPWVAKPTLSFVIAGSALALVWSVAAGYTETIAPMTSRRDTLSLTLLLYTAGSAALFGARREPGPFALFCGTAETFVLHMLLTQTAAWMIGAAVPLSWSEFWLATAIVGLCWAAAAYWVKTKLPHRALTRTPALLAGLSAAASAICAGGLLVFDSSSLSTVQVVYCVAALTWLALWAVAARDILLHVAMWNLLALWTVTLIYRVHPGTEMADLCVLPFGLYLILAGHLTEKRGRMQEARAFWNLAMLTIMLPSLFAYWSGVPGRHALLLMAECIFATLAGVGLHVRAYARAGLGFLAVLAASLLVRHLAGIGVTLVALVVGVGLFLLGYYILTNQEKARAWKESFETVWDSWR